MASLSAPTPHRHHGHHDGRSHSHDCSGGHSGTSDEGDAEDADQAAEDRHFNSCVHAFFDYDGWMRPEFERRERHWGALSPKHVALLGGEGMLQTRHNKALACLEQNARVLRDAVASHATEADKASSSGRLRMTRGRRGVTAMLQCRLTSCRKSALCCCAVE